MEFVILTIFPKIFESYLKESLLAKAQAKKIIKIKIYNIRDYTFDKHKKVDDTPYGGGPGMVMKIEPLFHCLKVIKRRKKSLVILLDPRGQQFNQQQAFKYSKLDKLILICGRYEGIDERVKEFIDESISIGPYILNGGEIAALTIIEATARLIKGFVGTKESLKEETYSWTKKPFEYPKYTRPAVFLADQKKLKVPKVLLSGNHQQIKNWQNKHRR